MNFNNFVTTLLVLCAGIVIILVIRKEFFLEQKDKQEVGISISNLNLKGQRIGSPDAAVQVIKFFDYQCPYCKESHTILKQLEDKFSDDITILFQHFPLKSHKHAIETALASECAGAQGKFRTYHNLLFENQKRLNNLSLDSLAIQAGVADLNSFRECLNKKETLNQINSNIETAEKFNIASIPTFIINDKIVVGAIDEKQFSNLISNAIIENRRE